LKYQSLIFQDGCRIAYLTRANYFNATLVSRYIKIKDIIAVKKSDNGRDTKTPVTLRNIGMININGIKNKNGFIIDKNNAG